MSTPNRRPDKNPSSISKKTIRFRYKSQKREFSLYRQIVGASAAFNWLGFVAQAWEWLRRHW